MLCKPKLESLALVLALCAGLGVANTARAQSDPGASPGQSLKALRATELRADKLGNAAVLSKLAAGATVRLLSVEGGWLQVELPVGKPGAPKLIGWMRASSIDWQAGAVASGLASGREAAGGTALTLGVRSLAPRSNRHALIIGIGRYADPATPPLPGTRLDKQSATQMAHAMQVPDSNIRYLQDDQATGDNIRRALQELTDKVEDGDRVFIHYSGHGTRYLDPAASGCVEALLAYDGGTRGTITNHEMASMLKTITNKTDKLFVMYDACHSGGLVQAASSVRTRGLRNANDEGLLRPKFASISEECGRATNVKTRNLAVEVTAKGGLPQDIVHISASRDNEVSFDDEQKGGLATQYMRDCMLREAKDLDNSGAISMDEIRQCAQQKIDKRMGNDDNYKPHHLVLNGNAAFVPAWFAQASAAPVAPPTAATASTASQPAVPTGQTGEQALRQMFDQRDAKRRVQVVLSKEKLQIGKDAIDFSVQSDRAGYVYLALAGSDNQSLYLLFPNDRDKDNKIDAGQALQLPRPNWRITSAGPAGTNNLLVLVTDAPRDLSSLAAKKEGPFMLSLNDSQGRAKLGALVTTAQASASPECAGAGAQANRALCSDAFGAAMFNVQEFKQ
jgi:hypothetical protein